MLIFFNFKVTPVVQLFMPVFFLVVFVYISRNEKWTEHLSADFSRSSGNQTFQKLLCIFKIWLNLHLKKLLSSLWKFLLLSILIPSHFQINYFLIFYLKPFQQMQEVHSLPIIKNSVIRVCLLIGMLIEIATRKYFKEKG